jgi:uncharacterized protein YqfA (UPF0365 family)
VPLCFEYYDTAKAFAAATPTQREIHAKCPMNGDPVILTVAIIGLLVFVVFLVLLFSVVRLWVQANLMQIRLSPFEIIGMKLRRTPATLILHTAIVLKQRKFDVPAAEIEACYRASNGTVNTALELATLVIAKRADAAG